MAYSEPWAVTEARRRKAAEAFPVLADTDPGTAIQIDNWEGTQTPVTDFTAAATRIGRVAAAVDPDVEAFDPSTPDTAPNVTFSWREVAQNPQFDPRDPYGIRAPYQGAPADAYAASSSVGETLGNLGGLAGYLLSAPAGAVSGALAGENPRESVRGAWEGLNNPRFSQFRDIGFVRNMSDEDVLPFDLSARDVAGGIAGLALDPLNKLALGKTAGSQVLGGSMRVEAGEAAVRGARNLAGGASRGAGMFDQFITPAVLPDEASQIGRVPGTDPAWTAGVLGEEVGPTGNVTEMLLGREPRVGENVNARRYYTNLGRSEQAALAADEQAAFRSASERAIAGADEVAGIGGGADVGAERAARQSMLTQVTDQYVADALPKRTAGFIRPDGALVVVPDGMEHDAFAKTILGPGSMMNDLLDEGWVTVRQGLYGPDDLVLRVGRTRPSARQLRAVDEIAPGNRIDYYIYGSETSPYGASARQTTVDQFKRDLNDVFKGRAPSDVARFHLGGGADLTQDEFARLAAKKAAGEALNDDEITSLMNAAGRSMGAMTDDEIRAAREALYNGPVPTDMRDVDTGLIEGVRGRLGAPTGRSVSDALGNARAGENPDVQAAIQKFGLTNNVEDAGFVLPDGRMLDFKHGASTADGLLEHESIAEAWWNRARDGRLSAAQAQNEMLGFMEDSGALRIGYGKRIAQFGTDAVTPEQRRVLGKMVGEITENGRNPYASVSVEFPDGTYRNVHNASELGAFLDPRMQQPNALSRARQVGGGADITGSQPPLVPLTPRTRDAGDDAMQALRDALDAEVTLRKSGAVANEIAAGRSRQAGRIASGLEAARGGTLEERIQIASGSARGRLRETFQQPLELTQEQITELADHLQDTLAGAGPDTPSSGSFEQLNGLRALNALVNGENVQPAQLKLLQRVFGDDIAGLVADANTGRISPRAVIDDAAKARIDKAAKFQERQIATLQERALAQFDLADDLDTQLTMNPTNSRLKRAEQQARQAGERAQAQADDLTVRRATALTDDPADALEALARQRSAYESLNNLRAAELAQRTGGVLTPEQSALLRAKEVVGSKLAISSATGKNVMRTIDELERGNRAILDTIKNDRPFLIGAQSVLTGDIPDSFLSAALQRRALTRSVLERQGVEPQIAGKMASVLFNDELTRHYGGEVPEQAKQLLQRAMRSGAMDDGMPTGLELLVQRAKNTMFGLGDVGVLGVQGLNALRRGNIPLLIGTINRGLAGLHLPNVATVADDAAIDRLTQYAIDGLHMGTGPSSARPDAGTMLSYLGKYGKMVDEKALNRASNAMNEVQFGKVLGTLRNLDYEGNLVMLRALGRDINNPRVRAQAAENANTLTSFARSALNANRRTAESTLLTSPSMTRARVNSILQMAKLVSPKASVEQRMMAASMILSTYVVYAGVMKELNDLIGVGDVEMDPRKPGFGVIKSMFKNDEGKNLSIDVIPQDAVERAFALSVNALTDPEIDDLEAQRAWERVLIGSGSIVTRGALAIGTRTGFEPGKGYRYGNLSGRGMIQSVLPTPPVLTNLAEGASPLEIGLGTAGITAYPDAQSGGRPTRPTRPQRPTRPTR